MILHRQLSELAGEGHLADIVACRGLYGDEVPFKEFDLCAIEVVAFTSIFELHLD